MLRETHVVQMILLLKEAAEGCYLTTANPFLSSEVMTRSTSWRTEPTAVTPTVKVSWNIDTRLKRESFLYLFCHLFFVTRSHRMKVNRVVFVRQSVKFILCHGLSRPHQIHITFPPNTHRGKTVMRGTQEWLFKPRCAASHVAEQQLFFCSFPGLKHTHTDDQWEGGLSLQEDFRDTSVQQEDLTSAASAWKTNAAERSLQKDTFKLAQNFNLLLHDPGVDVECSGEVEEQTSTLTHCDSRSWCWSSSIMNVTLSGLSGWLNQNTQTRTDNHQRWIRENQGKC